MKAAIYTPYLDTLGGGERYILSAAKVIADSGYSVFLETKDNEILNKAKQRFGLDFSNIKMVETINRGDGYDLCLWLSDGSIPTLKARKNILHFQRPFYHVQGKSLLNRAKFFRINHAIVNSEFTKKWIDAEYPVSSTVVYPPVDVSKFKPKKKDKLIIYVGRFSQLEQSKRQDVLMEAFKKLHDQQRIFKLILAGGSDIGRTDMIENLKESAKGYPVQILENIPFNQLRDLISSSMFFWSAAGFGIDEDKNPEKMEHFGMTVVEAMSSGCVPIIYNGGGHREIISNTDNGYLWNTIDELVNLTTDLISKPDTIKKIISQAKIDALKYSYENFSKSLQKLL